MQTEELTPVLRKTIQKAHAHCSHVLENPTQTKGTINKIKHNLRSVISVSIRKYGLIIKQRSPK